MTVGVEAGVFLWVLAAEDAVAAVTDALIGFGVFFGEPPSVTVGPTDWDLPTKIQRVWSFSKHLQFNLNKPLEIFLGLFWGLPFIGLPWRELIVFWGLPRCGLPVFDRGKTGINFSRVGDGNKAPSSTSKSIKFNEATLHPSATSYLDRSYAPSDVEWFHVSTVRKDFHQ